MQNHLDEFFAMVDFCNPGVLGSAAEFRRRYEAPILAGREPDATPEQVRCGCGAVRWGLGGGGGSGGGGTRMRREMLVWKAVARCRAL